MGAHWHIVVVTHIEGTISKQVFEDSEKKGASFLPKGLSDDFILVDEKSDDDQTDRFIIVDSRNV